MHFALLLLCFFSSGFAALLYETAWAREFEFVFGTSELAVVSVLAAYMGGLAAGSAIAGRLVARVRRPVLWYGLLELGIALGALAVPWAIRAATWLLGVWMGGQSAPPGAGHASGALFYVFVAFAVLVVPTGLMGATLPLLARHAVRRQEEIGARIGGLYAVNTAGAVAGAVATGFVLLPALGLRATVTVGALVNALVFAAAALLARASTTADATAETKPVHRPGFHWVLPLTALSGAVSFTYEVLWTRLLGHLVGGTIQGFATMLASFLAGIVIGSAVASRLARSAERSARGFAVAQLGTAALSLLAFVAANRLPELARLIGAGGTSALAENALIAALGLLPSSLCIGAIFPFAVRLVARDETEAGPAAARVYAWNTLGSIAGALASGFVLLPALRFAGTLSLAVAANLALALAAALLARPRSRLAAGLALAGLAALAVVRPPTPWTVLRHGSMLTGNASWRGEVAYYGVGRSSTVLLLDQRCCWRLTTNGLPESLIHRDGPEPAAPEPARWLGLLPALVRPDLDRMLVVGLGGGLTVESVPSTVKDITVIELEDEVVAAHEFLAEHRSHSPLRDPRVRLVVNDARGALQLTNARYGAIVSQPSHPWTAGASHLYTREFFELAKQHLDPGGVFVQWIGLAFVDEGLLRSLVSTLHDVFTHVALFRPAPGAVLFVASDAPIDPVAGAAIALERAPAEYLRFGLRVPEDVAAAWELGGDGVAAFAGDAAVITDDRNPLATHSVRIRVGAITAKRGDELLGPFEPLPPAGDGLDRVYLIRRLAETGALARATRLAEALPEPQRLEALAWIDTVFKPQAAVAAFRRAVDADPTSQTGRFGLVRMLWRRRGSADPEWLEVAASLTGGGAAVAQGWQHVASEDWAAVQALEPALAAVGPREPSHSDALRLRLGWRAASADPARREEAVGLAGEMLADSQLPEDVLLAARAYAAADRPDDALQLVEFLARGRHRESNRRSATELLETLRERVDAEQWRAVQLLLNAGQP